MKERGMIFNGEMVRALLDGRKTQTRRPVAKVRADNCLTLRKPTKTRSGVHTHVMDAPKHGLCPFGVVGDRIWVRETFSEKMDWEDGSCCAVNYSATSESPIGKKWKPSIHMPREHSRILLEITAVRVERLRSITLDDARSEGMGDAMPILEYSRLWNSIYPGNNWQSNPWVWVIEFKKISDF
ncbi:hypothetical protein QQF21_17005 [Lelliottia sp. V89_10]|uniref:hypothetical protein n=1 Tax=Lelliottia wanjuensis TaxID=3050585 RepID=UPI00249DDD4D|nr:MULTISPECIES: hypothetical protein [unclassified Lelliottia]MDI3359732.1 hypothetical protein [Lelliottia sp. V89_13]MDK9548690.1 hypothetical protein [Lelliottia sp. V89_5]MDK9597322.1 hypothetical protein [Lelliottia sp. V89_10]